MIGKKLLLTPNAQYHDRNIWLQVLTIEYVVTTGVLALFLRAWSCSLRLGEIRKAPHELHSAHWSF